MKPKIINPCPIKLATLKNKNFACQICKTQVHDMRDKSKEEITQYIDNTIPQARCAIFYPSQLNSSSSTSVSFWTYLVSVHKVIRLKT